MIRRLQLRNWRAYENLDLELGPGATFVVASNGIGKTSLVMAAAWGIFGDVAGVRGADEIRGEADRDTFYDNDAPSEQLDRQSDEPLEHLNPPGPILLPPGGIIPYE